MGNRNRVSRDVTNDYSKRLLNSKTVAFALMLAGAAGFVISLVAFEQQVLCLFGSTVLVFIGLAIRLRGRQNELNPGQPGEEMDEEPDLSQPLHRESYRTLQPRVQVPSPSTWTPVEGNKPEQGEFLARSRVVSPLHNRRLTAVADRAVEIFHQNRADVQVDIQREDRSIWHVTSANGKTYSVIIYEGDEVIDAGDLRALYSLMTNTGTEGGLFLTASAFTPQAREWAAKRAIQLFDIANLHTITLE